MIRVYTIILIFTIACLFESCSPDRVPETSAITIKDSNTIAFSKEKIEVAGIKRSLLQKKIIASNMFVKGRLLANSGNIAKVSFYTEAYVLLINAEKGDHVEAGEVLATIEHPSLIDLQRDYMKQLSQNELLEKEYQRQKALNKQKANAAKVFQEAKSAYMQSNAELTGLEMKLKMLGLPIEPLKEGKMFSKVNVYSPITGYIDVINITKGQYINPGNVLFEITNNDGFYIELQVFEKDINKIAIGQEVIFNCSNPESRLKTLKATIKAIGQRVDNTTKTFQVIAKPEKTMPGMRHGIFINAVIHTNEDSAYVLPAEALVQRGEKYFAFIEEEPGTFKKIPVKTGIHSGDFVELRNVSPVMKTRKFVVSGANYIEAEINKED